MEKPTRRQARPAGRAATQAAAGTEPRAAIGRYEWLVLLLAVWAVQAAFIPVVGDLLNGPAETDALGFATDPGASNPLNFSIMLLVLVALSTLTLRRFGPFLLVCKHNPLVLTTTLLVFASVSWSFDPELSLRRAGSYSVGVLLALYIVSRLSLPDIMRLFAVSTLIPGLCSVVYAIIDPSDAYMHGGALEGNLRGVYSHKNQLANVMAVGFLCQLYLAITAGHRRRHLLLAGFHAVLVFLAHSATSELSVFAMATSLGTYALWRKQRQVGALAILLMLAGLALVLWLVIADPGGLAGVLDRDVTLTGRTDLWPRLIAPIEDRLLVGWGYSAFWQVGNPIVDELWGKLGWQPPHAHNGVLEMTLDFGLLGLAACLLFFGALLIHALQAMRRGAGYEGWAYLAMLLYTALNNMIEISIMRVQEFAWLAFLVLYMCAGARARGIELGTIAAEKKLLSVRSRARPLAGAPTPPVGGSV